MGVYVAFAMLAVFAIGAEYAAPGVIESTVQAAAALWHAATFHTEARLIEATAAVVEIAAGIKG